MIHSVSMQLHRATTSVLLALIAFFTTLCDATDVEFILRAYVDSVAIKPGATAARLSCTFRMIFLKQRMSTGTASTFPPRKMAMQLISLRQVPRGISHSPCSILLEPTGFIHIPT